MTSQLERKRFPGTSWSVYLSVISEHSFCLSPAGRKQSVRPRGSLVEGMYVFVFLKSGSLEIYSLGHFPPLFSLLVSISLAGTISHCQESNRITPLLCFLHQIIASKIFLWSLLVASCHQLNLLPNSSRQSVQNCSFQQDLHLELSQALCAVFTRTTRVLQNCHLDLELTGAHGREITFWASEEM